MKKLLFIFLFIPSIAFAQLNTLNVGPVTRSELNPFLNGSVPLSGLLVNPNPTSAAPASLVGNTTEALFNDSQDTLAQAWADLFGTSQNTTHDTASFMATSQVGSSILQSNAISAFCRNKVANSYASGLNACVGVQTNGFNNVPGATTWGISEIFNEAPATSDTTTASAFLNESDFKVQRPTTNVVAWQYILDAAVVNGTPITSASASGPMCLSTNASKWSQCFLTGDGAAVNFSVAGLASLPASTTIASQFVSMKTSTTNGTTHLNRLHGLDNYTILDRDDGGEADFNVVNGDVFVGAGRFFAVNGIPVPQTDAAGHIIISGSAGNITSCGTNPSFTTGSQDNAGTIVVGSGTVTSCTLNFAASFATGKRPVPSCNATFYNSGQALFITARSSTSVTFSGSNNFGGDEINYTCF